MAKIARQREVIKSQFVVGKRPAEIRKLSFKCVWSDGIRCAGQQVRRAVCRVLAQISEDGLLAAFQDWVKRLERCVMLGGDYVEKWCCYLVCCMYCFYENIATYIILFV